MSTPIERLTELYDQEAEALATLEARHKLHPIHIDWRGEEVASTRIELLEQLIGEASEQEPSNIPPETIRQQP